MKYQQSKNISCKNKSRTVNYVPEALAFLPSIFSAVYVAILGSKYKIEITF